MLSLFNSIVRYGADSKKKVTGYQDLFKLNSKFYKNYPKKINSKKKIYIVHIDNYTGLILKENLYAKQLQLHKNQDVAGICATYFNNEVSEIDKSYNIENISYIPLLFKNFKIAILDFIKAIIFILKDSGIEHLINFRYKGIPIGNPIYDQIIYEKSNVNENKIKEYTCHKLDWKYGLKNLWEGMVVTDLSKKLFDKNPPSCIILSENTYIRSIVARTAINYGADIIVTKFYSTFIEKNSYVQDMELGDRQSIINHIIRKEYDNKDCSYENLDFECSNIERKKSIVKTLGLDPDKKNVVIMLHLFNDSPREQVYKPIYRDFYIWFVETLKIISNIKNVNWIIKDHPYSKRYGQSKEVEKLVKKYSKRNIKLISSFDGFNIIKDLSDYVVTVSGTVCLESTRYGIQCITAGIPFRGYCPGIITTRSKKEYKDILENIINIDKMDSAEIEKAQKRYIYWHEIIDMQKNELDMVFYDYINAVFLRPNSKERERMLETNKLKKIYIDFINDKTSKDLDNILFYDSYLKSYIK